MLSVPGGGGGEELCGEQQDPEQSCGFERTPAAMGGIFLSGERSEAVAIPN